MPLAVLFRMVIVGRYVATAAPSAGESGTGAVRLLVDVGPDGELLLPHAREKTRRGKAIARKTFT